LLILAVQSNNFPHAPDAGYEILKGEKEDKKKAGAILKYISLFSSFTIY